MQEPQVIEKRVVRFADGRLPLAGRTDSGVDHEIGLDAKDLTPVHVISHEIAEQPPTNRFGWRLNFEILCCTENYDCTPSEFWFKETKKQ